MPAPPACAPMCAPVVPAGPPAPPTPGKATAAMSGPTLPQPAASAPSRSPSPSLPDLTRLTLDDLECEAQLVERLGACILRERLADDPAAEAATELGMWRNGTAVAIDLFVDASLALDASGSAPRPLLLETWVMTYTPSSSSSSSSSSMASSLPMSGESSLDGAPSAVDLLGKAVRSFLHFSKLNAWILKSGGRLSTLMRSRICEAEDSLVHSQLAAADAATVRSFTPARLARGVLQLRAHCRREPPAFLHELTPRGEHSLSRKSSAAQLDSLASASPPSSSHPASGASPSVAKSSPRRPANLMRGEFPPHLPSKQQTTSTTPASTTSSGRSRKGGPAAGDTPAARAAGMVGAFDSSGLPTVSSPDPRKRSLPSASAPIAIPRGSSSLARMHSAESPSPAVLSPPSCNAAVLSPPSCNADGSRGALPPFQPTSAPPSMMLSRSLSLGTTPPTASPLYSRGRILATDPGHHQHAAHSQFPPRHRTTSHGSSLMGPLSPPSTLQRRRTRSTSERFSPSPSPSPSTLSRRLLGSFEESLFNGWMAAAPSCVQGFRAEIGACGAGMCPTHVKLPLPAAFYHVPGEDSPSPYVGTIDLDAGLADRKPSGLYEVPRRGAIQVVISNPEATGIKVFFVNYNLSDMPPRTRTFLRQRTYARKKDSSGQAAAAPCLRYAIHLRFVCSKKRRIYLYKDIRVVFAHRAPDDNEKLQVLLEGPQNPRFAPWSSRLTRRGSTTSSTSSTSSSRRKSPRTVNNPSPTFQAIGGGGVASSSGAADSHDDEHDDIDSRRRRRSGSPSESNRLRSRSPLGMVSACARPLGQHSPSTGQSPVLRPAPAGGEAGSSSSPIFEPVSMGVPSVPAPRLLKMRAAAAAAMQLGGDDDEGAMADDVPRTRHRNTTLL